MSAQPEPRMTYAAYLALEERGAERHEFLRGEVWAMAGGSPRHALIATNAARALGNALGGKPCAVFSADLRVRVDATDRTTYPDVTIVCGKRETSPGDENAVTNPVAVLEVLSESTEASDRGEKFAHLQRLPSLREYVLVSQEAHRVEVFSRTAENVWTYAVYGAGARARLPALELELDVAALYVDPTA